MMKMKQSDMEKEAKLRLLEKLSEEMSDLMTEQGEEESPKDMQKVTIAAPDKEGLEEGLDVAEEIIGKGPESLEALAGMKDESEFSLDDLDSEELSMFEDEEDEE